MHELSVAQNIVDAVLLEADRNGAKLIKEINLDVGELIQLDRLVLADALKILMVGNLKGLKVVINTTRALFSCENCNDRWGIEEAERQLSRVPDSLLVKEPESKKHPHEFLPHLSRNFVHCPKCGSVDITTIEGGDIKLRNVVMQ